MAYLLDTCAISEMISKDPSPNVVEWFEDQAEQTLFLSAVTVGEIEKGIFQLAQGKRRRSLESWLRDELLPIFRGRILVIDRKLMTTWARMSADLEAKGIIRPSFDSLIEASALHHQFILVTRNAKDFLRSQVTVLNPWDY